MHRNSSDASHTEVVPLSKVLNMWNLEIRIEGGMDGTYFDAKEKYERLTSTSLHLDDE